MSPNTPPYPTFKEDVHGLELVCPMKWEQLAPTQDANVRACGICKKDVTLCTSFVEVVHHTQRGHCVAVELSDGPPDAPASAIWMDRIKRCKAC